MKPLEFDPYHMMNRVIDPYTPIVAVDVGANVGETCRSLLRSFPFATVHAFEPVGDVFEKLREYASREPRVRPVRAAIGDREGTAEMRVTRNRWCSSLLTPSDKGRDFYGDWLKVERTETVPLCRLDAWAAREGISRVDFIKIDAQGFELEVLRGARRLLTEGGVAGVNCEAQLVQEYSGAATFSDIDLFFREAGFTLHQLHDIAVKGAEQQTSFVDGLWLRNDVLESLHRRPRPVFDGSPESRVRRAARRCAEAGKVRCMLYAAGRHTREIAGIFDQLPVEILAIIDDSPAVQGARIAGVPVIGLKQALAQRPDVVILSSGAHEDRLIEASVPLRDAGIEVVRLYPAVPDLVPIELAPRGEDATASSAAPACRRDANWYDPVAPAFDRAEHLFRFPYYARLNQRRLEHLASLGLDFEGKHVLEVGAGVGDLTHFWLDRGCTVHATDARPENLDVLRRAYAGHSRLTTGLLDLESPPDPGAASRRFDIVFCYGLLYHLSNPVPALHYLASVCDGLFLLETCVSCGSDELLNPVAENAALHSQAVAGAGCRPTRPWVMKQLRACFPHAYSVATQPAHEEFPLEWHTPRADNGLMRAVFVASSTALRRPDLLTELPSVQRVARLAA